MRRLLLVAASAVVVAWATGAWAAETLLWSGIVPDAGGATPEVSQYFPESLGGLYMFHTSGQLDGAPVLHVTYDYVDRHYVDGEGATVFLPDVHGEGKDVGFVTGVQAIADGYSYDFYGPTNFDNYCCYGIPGIPYLVRQTLITNISIDAKFLPDSVGQAFSFTYAGIPLPEPAIWVMMIAGFGLTGLALRRRPKIFEDVLD